MIVDDRDLHYQDRGDLAEDVYHELDLIAVLRSRVIKAEKRIAELEALLRKNKPTATT